MKSEIEVEYEENEDERATLTCFCCNFETNNIDELDEHILVNHDVEEENAVDKFEIVTTEETPLETTKKKRKLSAPVADADTSAKKVPRGKIIYRPRETKFEICKNNEFSIVNDDFKGPRSKRAKRTPAEEMHCHLCPFVTRKKSVLATHMLNHSDVIPPVYYKCSQCPYQTKRKNDMPKHMLGHCSHDSVPLYKCQYCPYVTKRKGDLPKHEMNHVERDKIFSWNCTECEYSSKRKNDLHKHMLIHSDRQLTGVFKCLKCAYATDKIVKFSRHVLSNCQVWDEPVNIEHVMLEDILANVDKDGVHVVLDHDSDGEGHSQGGNVQYVENNIEDGVEYIEYVQEIEGAEESEEAIILEGEVVETEYTQEESLDEPVIRESSKVFKLRQKLSK